MPYQQCKGCVYFEDVLGQCRRHPPRLVIEKTVQGNYRTDFVYVTKYPQVSLANDGCGDGEPANAVKDMAGRPVVVKESPAVS